MPLYSYKCKACDFEFDVFYRMDDRNIPREEPCPSCATSDTIFRVYSVAGFIDPGIIKADRNMERSGVQSALERIRDNHPKANMKWKG